MAAHHELGRRGEELARSYLEKKGYTIEAENWRFSRAEIDLVARDGDTLIFVEVKTRSRYSPRFGRPEEAVSPHKKKQLADAAAAYMREYEHEWAIRFDIVAVLLFAAGHFEIRHFPDAFFPGL